MDDHYYVVEDGKRVYYPGPEKPPVYIQAIYDSQRMPEMNFFFILGECLDWTKQGDDEQVIKPLIDFLAGYGDRIIFAFDDCMAQLLYEIDTEAVAKKSMGKKGIFSVDAFLYSRCAALVNGRGYYNQIRSGKRKLNPNLWFEALLYVPAKAWAQLHETSIDFYADAHRTPVCYETYSNREGWSSGGAEM